MFPTRILVPCPNWLSCPKLLDLTLRCSICNVRKPIHNHAIRNCPYGKDAPVSELLGDLIEADDGVIRNVLSSAKLSDDKIVKVFKGKGRAGPPPVSAKAAANNAYNQAQLRRGTLVSKDNDEEEGGGDID